MRILYLHQYFTTPDGASGTRSYEACRKMMARGHEVTVLCGSFEAGLSGLSGSFQNRRREGVVEGIKVVEYDLKYANSLSFFARLRVFVMYVAHVIRELSKNSGFDLIYATSTPVSVAIPALWANYFFRIPFIFEVRDLWPEVLISMGVLRNRLLIGMAKMLVSAAYKRSSACVALSPGMADGILALAPPSKVEVIPNGCDSERFITDPRLALGQSDVEQWLSKVGFDHSKVNFIYAGALGFANNVECLVDLVLNLPKVQIPKIRFYIVGAGKYREELEDRVHDAGLDDVIYVIDPVPKAFLYRSLCCFDAGLLLLRNIEDFQEGTSPNKFFDYLAAGLPVLANFEGWVARLLAESGAGLSAPGSEPQKFLECITAFANQALQEREQMRNASLGLAARYDRKMLALQQCLVCEDVYATL